MWKRGHDSSFKASALRQLGSGESEIGNAGRLIAVVWCFLHA